MKTADTHSTTSSQPRQDAAPPTNSFFQTEGERERVPAKAEDVPFFVPNNIQAKLSISQPGDPYEREADRVASQVVDQVRSGGNANTGMGGSTVAPQLARQISRKPIFESNQDEGVQAKLASGTIQREADAEGGSTTSDSFDQQLSSSKGGGQPLSSETQSSMGNAMGADLSGVRVHTGSDATSMSNSIGARAFTHGSDIYFNDGEYDTESREGQELLAHELTHTVQQGGSEVQPVRNNSSQQVNSGNNSEDTLQRSGNTFIIELKNFPVKRYAYIEEIEAGYTMPKPGTRKSNQAKLWRDEARPPVRAALESIVSDDIKNAPSLTLRIKNQAQRNRSLEVVGSFNTLAKETTVPFWNSGGHPIIHEIEHKVDWQILGDKSDEIDNLVLIDAETNRDLGHLVRRQVNDRVEKILEREAPNYAEGELANSVREAKQRYTIIFKTFNFSDETQTRSTITISDLRNNNYNPIFNRENIEIKKTEIPEGHQVLKTARTGAGFILPYNFSNDNLELVNDPDTNELVSVTYKKLVNDPNSYFESTAENINIPFRRETQDIYKTNARGRSRMVKDAFKLHYLSPVELDEELDFHPELGMTVSGKVITDIPLLSDLDISFEVNNGDFIVRAFANLDHLASKIPAPFQPDYAGLEIALGSAIGFSVMGMIGFSVPNLGRGQISAGANTENGFVLEGAFDFDSELFDPAQISVAYSDKAWTIGGRIGIPEGKVKGLKSAEIEVSYTEGQLNASGQAEPDIPGVDQATIAVVYNEEGISIAGQLALNQDIPGIKGGQVEVEVVQDAAGNWNLNAAGQVQPDIPGIDSNLEVSYIDGILSMTAQAAYERGMLSGRINVGVTNAVLNEEGQPTGDASDELLVYGGGSLTLQLMPWLAATAGVQFLPNGEIEIVGRIGLPSVVDVFPRKEVDQPLFSMPTIQIPIFAIPLGPRSIGIVATIDGGLSLFAGFGPGQLRELYAEVTYNPDRPEETSIHGAGNFVIPADAGLRLNAQLGLGVSIGIASLTGGIELVGELGIEGEASAAVDVNWSPTDGLSLDALGSLTANPKFKFDVNLFAQASLDLFLFELSETWRYNLTSFEWGPDFTFGANFPIHYREGEPFDVSFDDIEFVYPELSVGDIAQGVASDVKDDVF